MEPTKQEISQVFKRVRAAGPNKVCFDCGTKNPTWASVTYGVLICINCSAVHRSLGVHISFVRSTQLDSWTWVQLRAMQVGGNAAASAYFQSHGCTVKEAHAKYSSRAASMYKDKLHNLAVSTQKTYGTQLFFDLNDPASPTATDDFFSTISAPAKTGNDSSNMSNLSLDLARVSVSQTPVQSAATDTDITRQPSVDKLGTAATATSLTPTKTDGRSSLINKRKPATKPSFGGGGGGLGAQKVNRSFSEIEKQAEERQKLQEEQQQSSRAFSESSSSNSKMLSHDKSEFVFQVDRQKMASLDPVKAKQAERLGMGLARGGSSTTSSSHSAFSSMDTIDQVNPTATKGSFRDSSRYTSHVNTTDLFDEFGLEEPPTSRFDSDYPSRYDRSSYTGGDYGGRKQSSEPKFSSHSAFGSGSKSATKEKDSSTTATSGYTGYKGRGQKSTSSSSAATSSTTAQDRFSNSKSISSDQFFNRSGSDVDPDDSSFNRFSSSRAISSDDYFGRTPKPSSQANNVGSVVSKITGAANGVWEKFQEQYQSYTHKY